MFTNINTNKIRVQVNDSADGALSRIVEVEAYAAPPNVALASNGATASASTTLPGYPASNVIDGSRKATNGTLWLDNTHSVFPDWVEVDFNAVKTINEIDVITQQDNYLNPVEPTQAQTFSLYGIKAFEVQYWDGANWVTVPNGSVTNNDLVWRQFTFSPVTTSKIRVQVNGGADNAYSRVVEMEAYASTNDPLWVEDSLPSGATAYTYNDAWNWISSNPAPAFGTLAFQSNIAAGEHDLYFMNATRTLPVGLGDTLSAYVYLDPVNTPSEIMLSWNDGNWGYRAYWGANLINAGVDGTISRRYMGPLPATGQWVRLEVPASQVGLDGHLLTGMSFIEVNGRAAWDHAGK
jgi:hypothetical protein